MNCINLLPEHLRRAVMRKRCRQRFVLLSTLVGGATLVWGGILGVQILRLDQAIDRLNRTAMPARESNNELSHLRLEHQRLTRELLAIEAMRDPVSTAQILAQLSQLMPEDAVVSRITVTFPPVILNVENDRYRKQHQHIAGFTIDVSLTGIAATDTAMSELLDQLSLCDAFVNVRLVSNREAILDDGVGQVFHISMSIQLTKVPVDTLSGETS